MELAMKRLEKDIAAKREELCKSLWALKDRIQSAQTGLAAGRDPNALGVVQGLGGEIDRLAGELAQLVKIRDYWKE